MANTEGDIIQVYVTLARDLHRMKTDYNEIQHFYKLEADVTFHDLKQQIEAHTGIPVTHQTLKFGVPGKYTIDDLDDYSDDWNTRLLLMDQAQLTVVVKEDADIETEEGHFLAAQAIAEADVLLFCTGAGWSADSGLATYPGIADIKPYHDMGLEYYDLCQPHWLTDDPSIFYGFWGDSTNVYRNTTPHAGYDIIKKWRDRIVENSSVKEIFTQHAETYNATVDQEKEPYLLMTSEPFFSLTSNVDAHFWNPTVGAVFNRNEVTEIHGNVEYWQCNGKDGWYSVGSCPQEPWKLDDDFVFSVDKETMLAEEPYPRCPTCQSIARPSILMFMDSTWEELGEDAKYDEFYKACQTTRQDHPETKYVVIEIGCGLRVPSIRWKSVDFVTEMSSPNEKNVTFIRVNYAKHELDEICPRRDKSKCIFLHGKGLDTLRKIDDIVDDLLGTEETIPISQMTVPTANITDDSVLT